MHRTGRPRARSALWPQRSLPDARARRRRLADRGVERPRGRLRDLQHERRRHRGAAVDAARVRRPGACRPTVGSSSTDANLRVGDRADLRHEHRRERQAAADLAAFDCCPSWSPDGGRILFTSGRDGNNEIYVMNADGSGQRTLSPSPSTQEFGAACGRPTADDRLRTTDLSARQLGDLRDERRRWAPRNLTTALGRRPRGGGFLWSPDGRRIAFRNERDPQRNARSTS